MPNARLTSSSRPAVSIVMPCFNHAAFLKEAVENILLQTCGDFELLVVDDSSTDDSWQVLSSLAQVDGRIRPLRHPRNLGASQSRNTGMKAATGEFIAFCDSDDMWNREKLERQLAALRENPSYDLVFCDADIVDEKGRSLGKRFSDLYRVPSPPSGRLFEVLIRRNFINMQSVLMRSSCLEAGFFDTRIKWVEDWWYWVKLSHKHNFLYSPEVHANYRVHGNSTNRVQRRGYALNRCKVFFRILREYPDLDCSARAEIFYKVAVELQRLRKMRSARRFYFNAIALNSRNPGSILISLKAACRAAMPGGRGLRAPRAVLTSH